MSTARGRIEKDGIVVAASLAQLGGELGPDRLVPRRILLLARAKNPAAVSLGRLGGLVG